MQEKDDIFDNDNEEVIDVDNETKGDEVGDADAPIDYVPSTKIDTKAPMFYIEPKKEGCNRDDKLLMLSKKVGFYGLISFLILSIIFGAITKVWNNSLNLVFMALAVLAYGVQNILHLVAVSKCNCTVCVTEKNKLKIVIIACFVAFAILIALAVLKSMGLLGK